MKKELPIQAKNYLIESLNKKITVEMYNLLEKSGLALAPEWQSQEQYDDYVNKMFPPEIREKPTTSFPYKKPAKAPSKPETSFGIGNKDDDNIKPGKGTDTDLDRILFGTGKSGDWGSGAAAGAYAAGQGASILSNLLGGGIAKAALKGIPSKGGNILPKTLGQSLKAGLGKMGVELFSSLGSQAKTLSGAGIFDANVGDIAYQQLRNQISGAGKPFAQLRVPYDYRRSLAGYYSNIDPAVAGTP